MMMFGNLDHKMNKMTMTTNTKTKFFRTNFRKNFLFSTAKTLILSSFLLLLLACNHNKGLTLESLETDNGWGYIIKNNDKIIIKQSIIPVIQNQKSFENEEDALKVGNLVLKKLKANTSPTITKKDLILLSIKT